MRAWFACLCLLAAGGTVRAAETIPPAPTRYFNDYALTVKPETAERLNTEMEDFEKNTSTQVVAAIFPKMLSDSSVDDYAQRLYRAWKIGQKGTDNGVLMLVFVQDHKIWIQTGRGAEGALPDATCKDIIADQITPRFKANDFDGGMVAGVESVMKALQGEYKGTGTTQYDREHQGGNAPSGFPWGIVLVIVVFFILPIFFRRGGGGGTLFSGLGPTFLGGGFGGGFGGGSSGGSSGGGGGGFFSGGGGDSGGGGAGGSW